MLWRIYFTEFLLFFTTAGTITGSDKILFKKINHKISPLMKCISFVSEIYQKRFDSTIIIFEYKSISENIKEALINVLEMGNAFIQINDTQALYNLTEVYEGMILVVSYYETCEDVAQIDLAVFNIKFKYLIVIDALPSEECFTMLEDMLLPIRHHDATFLIKNQDIDIIKFVTFIPEVDESTCDIAEVTHIETINICHKDSLEKPKLVNIFPPKNPTNFKKCVFNVGIATLFPRFYAMLENKELYKNLDPIDKKCYGADVELIKILAEFFNVTLKMYYVYREEENPYLHLELLYYLLNGTLDACAGGLYRIYGDAVVYSGIYTEQSVIWVYTVEREEKSWQSLVAKTSGLYIFFLFYIGYAILWKLMSSFDNEVVSIRDTFFFAWGALVGASGLQDARSLKLKILNVFYLILCIHLSSYISTQIYYYLTINEPPQTFSTFDELLVSDRTPYLRSSAKIFVEDKKYNAFVNTSRDCERFYDCEQMMLKYKGTTIIIDQQLHRLQSLTAVNDEARVLKVPEDILFVYHEMIMRKNYILVTKFNSVTERLFESGIYNKLLTDAVGILVVDKARIAKENILSNSYSCILGCPISLRELAGAFYMWMLGVVIAFFIFVIERLLYTNRDFVA